MQAEHHLFHQRMAELTRYIAEKENCKDKYKPTGAHYSAAFSGGSSVYQKFLALRTAYAYSV